MHTSFLKADMYIKLLHNLFNDSHIKGDFVLCESVSFYFLYRRYENSVIRKHVFILYVLKVELDLLLKLEN